MLKSRRPMKPDSDSLHPPQCHAERQRAADACAHEAVLGELTGLTEEAPNRESAKALGLLKQEWVARAARARH